MQAYRNMTLGALHALMIGAMMLVASLALAQDGQEGDQEGDRGARRSPNNPTLARPGEGEERGQGPRPRPRGAAEFPLDYRTIDGTENNGEHPEWGSSQIEFLRLTAVNYSDGVASPAGDQLASPREISNVCAAQSESTANSSRASDFVWQWGQFLDHDIDLTPEVDPHEAFDIAVPAGDVWFDPTNTGAATIAFGRSLYNVVDGVRQQTNAITAFIDASNVYGSDEERARQLRTLDGTGRLATSDGQLLPFNVAGLPNAAPGGAPAEAFFLAGDFRANEQVGLTAMHTLFVREHNYWAERVAVAFPELEGEDIYQYARAIVSAEMQAITYREFLPILLGNNALAPYRGYDPDVDPGIANVFATAAYRFGHSMLSPQLLRLGGDGEMIAAGHLSLADAFFHPEEIVSNGIEPVLRGLAAQRAQEVDTYVIDEVRNFLFGPPGAGGFDLVSLNIQRGRDHGLASYNQVRVAYGLEPVRRFADIHPERQVRANLAAVYDSVDDIDAWVGGLAEAHVPGALVGETWRAVLKDQFERLRDGDRFWYQSYLPDFLVDLVEAQTLATIIRRNTDIGTELRGNVFRLPLPRPDL